MGLKKNHPKRQHCVPQFLLKNFTDPSGAFHVFDKTKELSFKSKPASVIAESGFYDFLDSDGEPQSFEYVLSDHEGTIATLTKSIIEQQSIIHLTPMDRLNIAQFAAVLQFRVQAVGQRLKSLHDGVHRILEERGIDGGEVFPKLTDEQLQQARLARMHKSIENGRVLAKRRWMLQGAPESAPFWISDNPVVSTNYLDSGVTAIEQPEVEAYLPISSKFSLYFVSDIVAMTLLSGAVPEAREQTEAMLSGKADQLQPDNVSHQNSLQMKQASRFIISICDDFELARQMLCKNPKLKDPPGYTVF